jgi:hypothetical protein
MSPVVSPCGVKGLEAIEEKGIVRLSASGKAAGWYFVVFGLAAENEASQLEEVLAKESDGILPTEP